MTAATASVADYIALTGVIDRAVRVDALTYDDADALRDTLARMADDDRDMGTTTVRRRVVDVVSSPIVTGVPTFDPAEPEAAP